MTFVSHARNFEDVLLWRALHHVEEGFYVDVGAGWPTGQSVTRAFYDRGWRGINVEPDPSLHALLLRDRPRDRNVLLAVDERPGRRPMVFFGDTGQSTLHGDVAARHVKDGRPHEVRDVEVTTLAALWAQYVPVGRSVHFLKVDVEDLDGPVLRGQDWSRNRPWIVVTEATIPPSRYERLPACSSTLLESRYVPAWADRHVRFFVAEEHAASLLPALRHAPGFSDDFVPAGQRRAEEGRARAEEQAARERRLAAEAVERSVRADARSAESSAHARAAEERAEQAERRVREGWVRVADAEARARDAEARADEACRRAREAERLGEEKARALAQLERSLACRLTKPLRALLRRRSLR